MAEMSEWEVAVQAARSRKGEDIVVLDIANISSFTDTFVICVGTNSRQNQAISDAIEMALKKEGVRPIGIEGHRNAEWILMDYGDFVVHIFSEESRRFYDLERLWRNAPRLPIPEAAEPAAARTVSARTLYRGERRQESRGRR